MSSAFKHDELRSLSRLLLIAAVQWYYGAHVYDLGCGIFNFHFSTKKKNLI